MSSRAHEGLALPERLQRDLLSGLRAELASQARRRIALRQALEKILRMRYLPIDVELCAVEALALETAEEQP